ncbi:ATP-grasp domain-containing protein [Roseofilum casamattae]|uniref:Succinate--CoA ligase subunit beta n=1 Tax=Roseofilum casamattae BLCC-M143 TaxID=3022442 RepID=A0ABT7BR53_9CYAN|nr:ATP-grasp domain-containing protein [Roseofilum casamattae]MDJ1181677.1 succinate--CoA ligase subunit beta [Roseofilum casamattae BLCC-M143]
MDLLEYQAKELFAETGIPTLPSECINHPAQLKDLKIPYPVVLKSQVRAGGRGKAGGIKFVQNTIDAVAAARAIANLPIMGDYPETILAEVQYNPDRQFYLAVVLDTSSRRPLLLGSHKGGVDLEAAMVTMQTVVVDRGFSPFYARHLALKMGLKGKLIRSVSQIVEKMYRLFVEKDLDLVEIDPLGVSADGSIMALDGKVTANDRALSRHPELVELLLKNNHCGDRCPPLRSELSQTNEPTDLGLEAIELGGTVGLLCNGEGLMMATLDLIYDSGAHPASCVNITGELQGIWLPEMLCDRLEQGLESVLTNPEMEVLLINLITTLTPSDRIAETILRVLQRRSQADGERPISIILRLVGDPMSAATQEALENFPIYAIADLETAVNSIGTIDTMQPEPPLTLTAIATDEL